MYESPSHFYRLVSTIRMLIAFSLLATTCSAQPGDISGETADRNGVRYQVDMKYFAAEYDSYADSWQRQWYDDKICFLNVNDDFTENPEWQGDVEFQWSDSGIHPPGNSETILLDPRYPILRRLNIVPNDDRLCEIKVRFTSTDIDEGILFFKSSSVAAGSERIQTSYKVIIYRESGEIGPVVEDILDQDQIEQYGICIQKDVWYHFLLEGLNHPTPSQPGDTNFTTITSFVRPKHPSIPIHPDTISQGDDHDQIRVLVEKVDVQIHPDNYYLNGPGSEVDPVQGYINEFIETGFCGGAWVRVNNDFSKEQLVVGDNQTAGIPDNQRQADEWNFDFEELCYRLGQIIVPQSPGMIRVHYPETIVYWEFFATGDIFHVDPPRPHDELSFPYEFRVGDNFGNTFVIEALEESEGFGSDEIRIEYYPDSIGMDGNEGMRVGKNFGVMDSDPAGDEAAFTAQEHNLMVDGDRDGEFNEEKIRDKFLMFWWNQDAETIQQATNAQKETGNRGSEAGVTPVPDSLKDMRIHQSRDIEDFAALQLSLGEHLAPLHTTTDEFTAETHLLEPFGGTGQFLFHVFNWKKGAGCANEHIEKPLNFDPATQGYRNGFNQDFVDDHLEDGHHLNGRRVTPARERFVSDEGKGTKTLVCNIDDQIERFVFEGVFPQDSPSLQRITTQLRAHTVVSNLVGSKYEMCTPVHIRVHPMIDFYDRFQIGPDSEPGQKLLRFQDPDQIFFADSVARGAGAVVHHFTDNSNDYQDEMFELPDDQYTVAVHGWNNNLLDKKNLIQTFFKRMYWQGYLGRIGAFEWPAMLGDDEGPVSTEAFNQTFNPSEFNSFRSGRSLLNLVKNLANSYSSDRISLWAHSQGCAASGEAMRLWVDENDQDDLMGSYFAANSAISAGIHGSNDLGVFCQAIRNLIDIALFYQANRNDLDDLVRGFVDRALESVGLSADNVDDEVLATFIDEAVGLIRDISIRWRSIRQCSDHYRYFGAGTAFNAPSDKFKDWLTIDTDIDTNWNWTQAGYEGEMPYLFGTDRGAIQRINLHSTADEVLNTIWVTNQLVKGLVIGHGSWPFAYSQRLTSTGPWQFTRAVPLPWMMDFADGINEGEQFSIIGNLNWAAITYLKFRGVGGGFPTVGAGPVRVLIWFSDNILVNPVIEQQLTWLRYRLRDIRSVFYNHTDNHTGLDLDLGSSTMATNPAPPMKGANCYEVLAFFAKSFSKPAGAIKIAENNPYAGNWQDKDEGELGNNANLPGQVLNTAHSYFYYHDCFDSKLFYRYVVDQMSEKSGIPSSYDSGNCQN